MKIKVFGELNDIVKDDNIVFDNVIDITSLKNHLYKLYPLLKEKKFAVAVNKQIAHENILLNPDAEVALLPPFSGG